MGGGGRKKGRIMKAEGRNNLRCDKEAGSICPRTQDNMSHPLRELRVLRGQFARLLSSPAILSTVLSIASTNVDAVAAKWACRAVAVAVRWACRAVAASAKAGQTVVNSVKTSAIGQSGAQIVCKYLQMNGLQNNWRSVQSNSVKVNQTDMMSSFEVGAGEGNRILSENVHNSLNCPVIVHCKPHIFHHLRIKRHGDDQALMQIDASASVISRPCALVRSYHNTANWRVKTEILSGPPERARSVKASASRHTRQNNRNEAGRRVIASHYRGAAGLAGFMPGPGAGTNHDRRA